MSAAENAAALDRIRQRLSGFFPPWEVDAWLGGPHAQLGGDTPLSVIAAGHVHRVTVLIDQMTDGDYL